MPSARRTIRLADVGPFLGGRPLAEALRSQVEGLAANTVVVVDLEGVQAMSPSFADELFAKLDPDLWRAGRVVVAHADEQLKPMVDVLVARRANGT